MYDHLQLSGRLGDWVSGRVKEEHHSWHSSFIMNHLLGIKHEIRLWLAKKEGMKSVCHQCTSHCAIGEKWKWTKMIWLLETSVSRKIKIVKNYISVLILLPHLFIFLLLIGFLLWTFFFFNVPRNHRILVLQPGIAPGFPAVEAWSPDHWTAWEFHLLVDFWWLEIKAMLFLVN